jgi:AcrR family transcriptional regulator
MERKGRRGKSRRVYDASGRRAQASRTHAAVLDAAERLFLADGYAATTIGSIADAAAVSVETIYKVFRGKPGLVRAIRTRRLAGTGPIPAESRSNRTRRTETDSRKLVAEWGRLTAEVAPLVCPILLLVRDAAAADPEMATLRTEVDADRLRRMTLNARHLHRKGHVRIGISVATAADVLWTYSSPELFELLVVKRGWSVARYGTFVGESIAAALLDDCGAIAARSQ